MKIDRLLNITVYLLNHDRATAKALSERFNVSTRTIQRDIVALSAAGIPVWADAGAKGGYAILDSFKLKNHVINTTDIQMVRRALEGLYTAYHRPDLAMLMEKYASFDATDSAFTEFSIAGGRGIF